MTKINDFAVNDTLTVQRQFLGNEQSKIVIIDNFLHSCSALVNYAKDKEFAPYPALKDKKGYPGHRFPAPADYSAELIAAIRPILSSEFNIDASIAMQKSDCNMSLTTVRPEDLGPIQVMPHFDTSLPNHFAILLYLCNEEHGGTAFYRHNATNFEVITKARSDLYLDTYFAELNKGPLKKQYFTESNDYFTKIGMVEAKVNRLAIYSGNLLHTAYINQQKSISLDPVNGRLTVNTFVAF
jgi:hypothetical protein